jgi:hypothetical protein
MVHADVKSTLKFLLRRLYPGQGRLASILNPPPGFSLCLSLLACFGGDDVFFPTRTIFVSKRFLCIDPVALNFIPFLFFIVSPVPHLIINAMSLEANDQTSFYKALKYICSSCDPAWPPKRPAAL